MAELPVILAGMASPLNAEVATRLLQEAGLPFRVYSSDDFMRARTTEDFGVLLMELGGLSRPMLGKLKELLESQPSWSDLHVALLIQRQPGGRSGPQWLGTLRNVMILEKPVTAAALISDLRIALQARRRQFQLRDLVNELQELNQTLERRIQERTDSLERSNRDLEQFAYAASHDLREPLRGITMFLELLKSKYAERLDGTALEYINYATDSADRTSDMVRDLLAYARVGGTGEHEAVDLQAVVEYAKENLRAAILDTDAVIRVDTLPTVTASASQMKQLFQNLLANALKFRMKGRRPEIHVSATSQADQWVIAVADNGIGIKPEDLSRIFNIFTRLHGQGEYSGSGIGLAICRKIVERHGGRIWAESRPGEGSTLFFTLPR